MIQCVKQFTLHTSEACMSGKDLNIGFLFDFYGELLSARQKEIFELYYNDDLSLAETAEQVGITRQGVRDMAKKAEAQLIEFEEKLGLAKRFLKISAESDAVISQLEEISKKHADASNDIDKIIQKVKSIAEIQI